MAKMIATYRLQVNKDFTLGDAALIVPYLKELGISDIYLSPIFESTPGSMHGYDICNFTKISGERGGEDAFEALHKECEANNLRLLLDIVPNHMGIGGENPFWFDVLCKGKKSAHWSMFDLRVEDEDKIHLPILGASLEELVSENKITIDHHPAYGRGLFVEGRFLPVNDDSGSDNIEAILDTQHYKLVSWMEAFNKISYRRFFDITDLVGVRVEEVSVYDLTHKCLFGLLKKYPAIGGVRVDHVDGLADPPVYLDLLARDVKSIWVEKILSGNERLPPWPVKGTTGYEFIHWINNLLVNPEGFSRLEQYWLEKIEPQWEGFEACVLASKEHILDSLFPSELKRLVKLSSGIADEQAAEIFWRGITVAMPVYRTYAGENPHARADRNYIDESAKKAGVRYGKKFKSAADLLLPKLLKPSTDLERQLVREWQQLSGPAMAKGLEDCAHYRYTPLAALNEVGCAVEIKENIIEQYFSWAKNQLRNHPDSLLATSTHDTKRSEDARHRLYVLADRPEDWIEFYEECADINKAFKNFFPLRPATEYFLYQAIVAVWQRDVTREFAGRIRAYMKKSVKEARLDTNWLEPDEEYEERLDIFIKDILGHQPFIETVRKFVSSISAAGEENSLVALTLKILGPGIPDIYQGCDDWDFSLVDPDNRRPVDYTIRPIGIKKDPPDQCSLKLWLTRKLLGIRRVYLDGGYTIEPMTVSGEGSECIIAYKAGPLYIIARRYPGRPNTKHLQAEIHKWPDRMKNLLVNMAAVHGNVRELLGDLPVGVFVKE